MGYLTVLAVVNEHTSSTMTARYAIAMAAAVKAHLILYAVHGAGTCESVLLGTERHLDHLFAVAFEHDIAVTRITEVGAIGQLLPGRARAECVDLVFYPLPPGERYGAALQKHTVHTLLRTIDADLAIMRIVHMGKPHPRHILVPLGATVGDRPRRINFLAALAKSFHSQITLFHRSAAGKSAAPEDFALMRRELLLRHQPVLERSGAGHIARSIAMEAISHHNDLIVLGASERGTLRRLFFGNPAGDVMHNPPCNAILFRSAAEKP